MLRLPEMAVEAPDSVDGVLAALARPRARLVAGGTDLLPNLKHRLGVPERLVSLTRVAALRRVAVDRAGGFLRIGAGVTLTDVAAHPDVLAHAPSLAAAAGLVASPLIRNAGTIGGNVNLDTRCRYVNQSEFWRAAVGGGCLKSEGDVCHVVPGGQHCVAAMSSDCVPVLVSLDASVVLRSARGEREVAIDDYYDTDGVSHVRRDADELMTEVRVPLASGPRRATYAKWTVRQSIDFPLVSVALRFDLDADSTTARVTAAVACLGVLAARPKRIVAGAVVGRRLDDAAMHRALADLVGKQGKPLDNVPYEAAYRRKMIPVYTRRAVAELVARG